MHRMDLAKGIAAAMAGNRQVDVAAAVGVSQNTVSRWKTGTNLPRDIAVLSAIEEACGRPQGFILAAAEYVKVTTVLEAIDMDPELDDPARSMLRAAYRAAIESIHSN